MSLPDTVFIFVLALIIFGPKKLPEIGRQLGRLVGEFRRASNEFKFQIEEELRQVELSDRQTTSAHKNELESSTADSSLTASESLAESEPLNELDAETNPEELYPEETLPVGQYPNIDNLNPHDLDEINQRVDEPEFAGDNEAADVSADTPGESLTVRAADGAQPRTNDPYTQTESAAYTVAESTPPAAGIEAELEHTSYPSTASVPPAASENPIDENEPDPHAAPSLADIHHG